MKKKLIKKIVNIEVSLIICDMNQLYKDVLILKHPHVIRNLAESKILFKKVNEINWLLKIARQLYKKGPGKISEEHYINLKYNIESLLYKEIPNIKNDSASLLYSLNFTFNYLLRNFFILKNRWEPIRTKTMKELKKIDAKIHNIFNEFLSTIDTECKYKKLKEGYDYIVKTK